MKRNFTFVIALLMLLSNVSCTKSEESDQGKIPRNETVSAEISENNNTDADNSEKETARSEINDGIGEYDFEGRTYRIVYSEQQFGHSVYPYDAFEETGEVLNDTIYRSRINTEERFNTTIEYYSTGGTWTEVTDAIKASVISDDGSYQLGIGHMYAGFTGLVNSNMLYDFMDLHTDNYIDLERPWWNQSLTKNILVNNTLLTAVSDFVYSYVDVIYFNKEMLNDCNIESPYVSVYDGSWTWDKLTGVAEQVSSDLNGDGIFDDKDRYGYSCEKGSLTTRFIHSNGLIIGTYDQNGWISVNNLVTDKMQEIVEKAYDIYWNGNMTHIANDKKPRLAMFRDEKALFAHAVTVNLNDMREVEFEFGIVPLPKYNEGQEKYYSMASTQMLLLPSYIDCEFSGIILEALSAESYKYVVPSLYEKLFENKYLRDEESYNMYLIIRDSLVYDPIWVYGDGNAFAYLIDNTAMKKSTDLASFVAKNQKAIQSALDKVSKALFERKD